MVTENIQTLCCGTPKIWSGSPRPPNTLAANRTDWTWVRLFLLSSIGPNKVGPRWPRIQRSISQRSRSLLQWWKDLLKGQSSQLHSISQAFMGEWLEECHFEKKEYDSLLGICQMPFKGLWQHEEKDSLVWWDTNWNSLGRTDPHLTESCGEDSKLCSNWCLRGFYEGVGSVNFCKTFIRDRFQFSID